MEDTINVYTPRRHERRPLVYEWMQVSFGAVVRLRGVVR